MSCLSVRQLQASGLTDVDYPGRPGWLIVKVPASLILLPSQFEAKFSAAKRLALAMPSLQPPGQSLGL